MTDTNSNRETVRLQQLQLMGITSYFPRFALPGALPSEPRSWPPADEPSIIPQPVEPRQDASPVPEWRVDQDAQAAEPVVARSAAAQQKAPREQQREQQRAQEREQARTPPGRGGESTHEEETDAVLRLHLLLIPVDASLCILNQIPVLAQSRLPERQQKLLDNILFFLGRRNAAYHSMRTFRWPLPGMEGITSAAAAQSSLMHFLEQFFQEHPFSNLLVMGEQGADWTREAGELQTGTSSALQWQMLHTYSLDQMLTLPAIKREVWQHLLPLHARLNQA